MNSSEIEAIRAATDIVQIIGEVVPLKKKSGTNFFGVCPFHNEKTPSFSVSSTKQLFHCFGCKEGGDVFHFVQSYYKWDFTQSVEELAKRAGIKLEPRGQSQNPHWEEGFSLLAESSDFYRQALESKSHGTIFRDYLETRHIPQKLWEPFQLGAHPGGSDDLARYLNKKKLNLQLAGQLGLISRTSKGDWVDRFQGRLMFPILDERGRVRGFGGRGLNQEQPKYLNSPKTSHFDKSRLLYGIHLAFDQMAKKGYVVLCEGYLDVIALHEFGISNAVGSMGTALTAEQIRLFKRWTHRAISLYDADAAGLSATIRNLKQFFKEGVESKVVLLPDAKDPDSFLHNQKVKPAQLKASLKKAFDSSRMAIDYWVEKQVLVEKNAMARGQRLRELVELLDEIPDPIERAVLQKDLAKRFELPEELMVGTAATVGREPLVARPTASAKPSALRPDILDRWAAKLAEFLVIHGEKADFSLTEILPFLSSRATQTTPWIQLINRWGELLLNSKSIAELQWLQSMEFEDETLQGQVREWSMAAEALPMEVAEVQSVWDDLLKGLKRAYYQLESGRLQDELRAAEAQNDTERTRQLLIEKQDLARIIRVRE